MRPSVIWFLFALAPAISAADVHSTVRALESRYRHAATLKAAFLERYRDGNGGTSSESGTVYFSRPGRMRWEYESPEPKLFLVDGANVWFYIPADHAVSRAKMKESSDWRTPFALLAGKANLAQLCRSIEAVGTDSGAGGGPDDKPSMPRNTLLRCVSRGISDGTKIATPNLILETDPQARLVRVVIREPGHAETEFRFGNWEENIAIPEAKFHFQPPPGVAIVDEASLVDATP